jgi:tRNA dimethylallyltransferase
MTFSYQTQPVIVIVGPTGVGKSDFALQLAERLGGEIVNADLGQLYTPLTIGTAKPLWREARVPHHGFDLIDHPLDYNVIEHRSYVISMVDEIQQRGHTPLVVGGSSFYWNALFFPPDQSEKRLPLSMIPDPLEASAASWELLESIDPQRARELHPHDHYRITRAVSLWKTHGILPSLMKPLYNPFRARFLVIATGRPRRELADRINCRVDEMLHAGWVQETRQLSSAWHTFLLRKKLIGYDDIIREGCADDLSHDCVKRIKQRTRQYAKRQEIYWRSWKKKFDPVANNHQKYYELSLTLSSFDLYLEQLRSSFNDVGISLS